MLKFAKIIIISFASGFLLIFLCLLGLAFLRHHNPLKTAPDYTHVKGLSLTHEDTTAIYQAHENDIEPYLIAPCVGIENPRLCLADFVFSGLEAIPRSKDIDITLLRTVVFYSATTGDAAMRQRAFTFLESLPTPLTEDQDMRVIRAMKMVLHYSMGHDAQADEILESFKGETKPFPYRGLPQYGAVNILLAVERPDKARQIIEHTADWKMTMLPRQSIPFLDPRWYGPVMALANYYLKKDQPDEASAVAQLFLVNGSSYYEPYNYMLASADIAKYYDKKGSVAAPKHEEMCEQVLAHTNRSEFKDGKHTQTSYQLVYKQLKESKCWGQMKTLAGVITGNYQFRDELNSLLHDPIWLIDSISKEEGYGKDILRYAGAAYFYHLQGKLDAEKVMIAKLFELYERSFKSLPSYDWKLSYVRHIYPSLKRVGQDEKAKEILNSLLDTDISAIPQKTIMDIAFFCQHSDCPEDITQKFKNRLPEDYIQNVGINNFIEAGNESEAADLFTRASDSVKSNVASPSIRKLLKDNHKVGPFFKQAWPYFMKKCIEGQIANSGTYNVYTPLRCIPLQ